MIALISSYNTLLSVGSSSIGPVPSALTRLALPHFSINSFPKIMKLKTTSSDNVFINSIDDLVVQVC
jgi:hypothetical protein